MKIIHIRVNGDEISLGVDDAETLQDALRERLGLTGIKKGCSRGVCGACTVLVNGEPKNACLTLAARCDGFEITTIEGLGQDGDLHPIQKAFIHSGVHSQRCDPVRLLHTGYGDVRLRADPAEP